MNLENKFSIPFNGIEDIEKYYDLPVSMLDDELMFCNMENCKSYNKCRKNIEKYDKFFNQSNIIFI